MGNAAVKSAASLSKQGLLTAFVDLVSRTTEKKIYSFPSNIRFNLETNSVALYPIWTFFRICWHLE